MHGKPAYAVQCDKCGNEYPIYKYKFKEMYIGTVLPNGGTLQPTHGKMSYSQSMDRGAKDYFDKRKREAAKRIETQMCDTFHISHEEYHSLKKKWADEGNRARKRFEQEATERANKRTQDEINKKSQERKALIDKGILVYKKGIGLVNTQTGEVVKL